MKKKFMLLICLFFLFISLAYGGMIIQKFTTGSGGTDKWVGFPNTTGSPSSPVGSWVTYGADADRVYGRNWTATEGGTVKAVNIYLWAADDFWDHAWLVVYNGTTLIGKSAELSNDVSDGWKGDTTIVVEGGESLVFSTSQELYFGIAWDNSTTNSTDFGRDDGASENINYYDNTHAFSTAPPPTVTWADSTSEGYGVILKYTN